MKKIYLPILTLLFTVNCFAQDYKKTDAFGFGFTYHDFKNPAAIKNQGLVNVINQKQLLKTKNMDPGVCLNYLHGLSNHVDFTSSLGVSFGSSSTNTEVVAGLNLKLLPDKYIVVPFIDAGIGASSDNGYFGAFTPVGAGLQVNFFDEVFLLLNSQYRIPVTETANKHLYYSAGIAVNLGK
jgi:hypothetical protein